MKPMKYFLFTLCIMSFSSFSANALHVKELDSENYLLNHGHSPEVVRLVKLQNNRTSGTNFDTNESNRFTKFFKNLYVERDLTMPLRDFGNNKIHTPEAR